MKKNFFKILIGTNNKGKFKEIRALLPKKVVSVNPAKFKIKSPIENGKTFKENAIIKAKYFSKKSNLTCISDDSGLEIDLLNGEPGIFSARWGGKNQNFKIAIKRVFKNLSKKDKNWKKKKIKARFVCALSICYMNEELRTVTGKVEGRISPKAKGKNGFGYDPIFIPLRKNKTFAEIDPLVKYKIDHRSIAFKKIKKFF